MDLKKILTKPKRKYYQWKFSFYPNNTVLCSSFLILKFSDMDAAAFLEDLKSKVHPEAIVGHDTVFHFDITGDSPTQKTIQIADGKLEVFDGLVGEAKCTIKANGETLLKLATGKENPMMAYMMGKIKISNPGEMMKYAKIFGLI